MSAGGRLRHRDRRIAPQGGIVVHLPGGREQAAVAVIGVLIQAQVGHEHRGVAHLSGQVLQRELDDAGRVVGG